ncbi:cell cycle control protein [Tritrichomonas foetus]|uniref:Cell cycle control protein n=1 Tax=Tritrichomonas foetus TaxID=1144522 RepID=A0A1J4KK15_9EUKA|nr:cell cycle control protein [Tritrichomonas foetus]|eukprot:OHT11288.1 cell cycle control protein [Tritrichomonas foetus]
MRQETGLLSNPCLQTHPACQQNLRGCRPTLDHRPLGFFLTMSIFHLLCGILLITTSLQVKEYKVRYDNLCKGTGDQITVKFDNAELSGMIYLYYELHGFYQAHFRFVSSFSADQMQGRYVESTENCDPVNDYSANGGLPMPCGLLPTYFFNDYYEPDQSGFEESGIVWKNEIDDLFKPPNSQYSNQQRWMRGISDQFPNETQNEHFIAWMRVAHQPTFRKLFMKANTTIKPNLNVRVFCNYDKEKFDGERWLVILKPSGMGGNNIVLAIINFVVFAVLLVFALIFKTECCCINRKRHPQGFEKETLVIEENVLTK